MKIVIKKLLFHRWYLVPCKLGIHKWKFVFYNLNDNKQKIAKTCRRCPKKEREVIVERGD